MEVQQKLQEQLEVQSILQLRIEAQGRYLQSILEKAQQTLSGQNVASIELEAARAELSDLASRVSPGCLSSSFALVSKEYPPKNAFIVAKGCYESSLTNPSSHESFDVGECDAADRKRCKLFHEHLPSRSISEEVPNLSEHELRVGVYSLDERLLWSRSGSLNATEEELESHAPQEGFEGREGIGDVRMKEGREQMTRMYDCKERSVLRTATLGPKTFFRSSASAHGNAVSRVLQTNILDCRQGSRLDLNSTDGDLMVHEGNFDLNSCGEG